jgi:hypothetical protein
VQDFSTQVFFHGSTAYGAQIYRLKEIRLCFVSAKLLYFHGILAVGYSSDCESRCTSAAILNTAVAYSGNFEPLPAAFFGLKIIT